METTFAKDAQLDDELKIAAAEGQVSSEMGEERIILSLDEGVYYGLNPVGARVWTLLQEPTTVGAVREQLLAEYEVEPAQCERDLRTLLRDLARHDLIEVLDERTATDSSS